MKTITIALNNGKWTVNDKPYIEMDVHEREFFHRFINEVRAEALIPFEFPTTIKGALTTVKDLISRINVNDPIFELPLARSSATTRNEMIMKTIEELRIIDQKMQDIKKRQIDGMCMVIKWYLICKAIAVIAICVALMYKLS